jgi:hypothetical protein
MSTFKLTRRGALIGLSALVIVPAAARPADARPGPFGGIRVDVAPLRENAGDPTAGWVAQALPKAIAEALAATGRSGTPAFVQIDYVILGPSSGGALPAGASPDQMIGAVIVDGAARPLRASTSYYPMSVDQPDFEQANHNRVVQLCQAFAYWVAREV